jgi:hypothetical protein
MTYEFRPDQKVGIMKTARAIRFDSALFELRVAR